MSITARITPRLQRCQRAQMLVHFRLLGPHGLTGMPFWTKNTTGCLLQSSDRTLTRFWLWENLSVNSVLLVLALCGLQGFSCSISCTGILFKGGRNDGNVICNCCKASVLAHFRFAAEDGSPSGECFAVLSAEHADDGSLHK